MLLNGANKNENIAETEKANLFQFPKFLMLKTGSREHKQLQQEQQLSIYESGPSTVPRGTPQGDIFIHFINTFLKCGRKRTHFLSRDTLIVI